MKLPLFCFREIVQNHHHKTNSTHSLATLHSITPSTQCKEERRDSSNSNHRHLTCKTQLISSSRELARAKIPAWLKLAEFIMHVPVCKSLLNNYIINKDINLCIEWMQLLLCVSLHFG